MIKPSIKEKGQKEDNEYTFKKLFLNDDDKNLDKSNFNIIPVWNSWDYFTVAMEEMICQVSDDLIYTKSNLASALEKAILLHLDLPPSASKETLGKAILYMHASLDMIGRTLVTTGRVSSVVCVAW